MLMVPNFQTHFELHIYFSFQAINMLKFLISMVILVVASFIQHMNIIMEPEMPSFINIRLIMFDLNNQATLRDFKLITMVLNYSVASRLLLIYIISRYYFNMNNLIEPVSHFDMHLFILLLISNTCEQYEAASYDAYLQLQIMMDNNIIKPFISQLKPYLIKDHLYVKPKFIITFLIKPISFIDNSLIMPIIKLN